MENKTYYFETVSSKSVAILLSIIGVIVITTLLMIARFSELNMRMGFIIVLNLLFLGFLIRYQFKKNANHITFTDDALQYKLGEEKGTVPYADLRDIKTGEDGLEIITKDRIFVVDMSRLKKPHQREDLVIHLQAALPSA